MRERESERVRERDRVRERERERERERNELRHSIYLLNINDTLTVLSF